MRHPIVFTVALVGCAPSAEAPPWEACAPDRPAPYAQGAPYLGVHADAANSDVVPCATADAFTPGWRALMGQGITQPNTFSPDGHTTYVTATHPEPDGCRVYALDVATGASRWCRSYPPSVTESAVEVDQDGHLYFTTDGVVVSLDAEGAERWVLELGESDAPWGVHFAGDGSLITVTPGGVVFAIDRSDGAVIDRLSIADTWGFVEGEDIEVDIDITALFPAEVAADLEGVFGAGTDASGGAASFLGSGAFVDNTIAISPRGDLFVIGGGPDEDTGALVQIRFDGGHFDPGWYAPTRRGSATSPSVSADGRFVVIGDGASLQSMLVPGSVEGSAVVVDIDACDANGDGDADPAVCSPVLDHPLERGPMVGSPAILPDGTTILYEFDLAFGAEEGDADLMALAPDGAVLWQTALPDDMDWTSVVTVTQDHILGTATRIEHSDTSFLGLALPSTATSALIVLDRDTGALVSHTPVSDDSSATVAVGPGGELYVGLLGVFSMLSLDQRPTLGLLRMDPVQGG